MQQFTKAQFITITRNIIKEEGIQGVSIRHIGARMNCSSAAIYKHFDSLEHLVLFACLEFMEPYVRDVRTIESQENDGLNTYFKICESFARNAFGNPYIYERIFLGSYKYNLDNIFKEYFQIVDSRLKFYEINRDSQAMLLSHDLHLRNLISLKKYAKGYSEEELKTYNDLIVYMFIGMIHSMISDGAKQTDADFYVNRYLHIIRTLLHI